MFHVLEEVGVDRKVIKLHKSTLDDVFPLTRPNFVHVDIHEAHDSLLI